MAAGQCADVTELKFLDVPNLGGIEEALGSVEFESPRTGTSANEIKGIKFVLIVGALLLGVMCVALDNTSE